MKVASADPDQGARQLSPSCHHRGPAEGSARTAEPDPRQSQGDGSPPRASVPPQAPGSLLPMLECCCFLPEAIISMRMRPHDRSFSETSLCTTETQPTPICCFTWSLRFIAIVLVLPSSKLRRLFLSPEGVAVPSEFLTEHPFIAFVMQDDRAQIVMEFEDVSRTMEKIKVGPGRHTRAHRPSQQHQTR